MPMICNKTIKTFRFIHNQNKLKSQIKSINKITNKWQIIIIIKLFH